MSDSDLFDQTLAEIGVEPGHPRADQLRAAVEHVSRIADNFARQRLPGTPPPLVFRLGDAAPPAIVAWLGQLADDFTNVRRCRHATQLKPTFMWAGDPHRARCVNCEGRHETELRTADRNVSNAASMACDFCGLPRSPFALHVVAVPLVTVLVRGLACPACLAPAPVGAR